VQGGLLDYLRCQDADLDIGPLGRLAQQVKRLAGPAPLLRHQDALGLLDHRHGLQPGLQPGERGVAQDLLLLAAPSALADDPLPPLLGFFKPSHLGVEL
jgi:hypothetical protein